ncbi:hypothetical protein CEXT_91231 [Caerostris extrusa]|uniref:Uncharacterized protein n=1 Tax=Caerostris extrusa TaxID=172846 RepID=A0AAV4SDW7_CAEEX|nr:hypothetical protein CEXT_91231 [Caerostris extrusa]
MSAKCLQLKGIQELSGCIRRDIETNWWLPRVFLCVKSNIRLGSNFPPGGLSVVQIPDTYLGPDTCQTTENVQKTESQRIYTASEL